MIKSIFKILVLSLLLSVNSTVNAQDTIGQTIKEIFLKGSIDDNKLFLVVGLEKGSEILIDGAKNVVDLENIKEIGRDLNEDLGDYRTAIFNKEHEGDIVDAIKTGIEVSKETGKEIVNAPLQSLKKIPQAFKISMESAREGYYESESRMNGTLKYTGHAVWATTKAGYYLVIEAPARAILNLAATVVATPVSVGTHVLSMGLNLAWDAGKYSLKIGSHLVRSIVSGVYALTAFGYSAISTTVAITATTVAAGAVALFDGAKWLVLQPFKLFNPARAKIATNRTADELNDVINQIKELASNGSLQDFGVNTGYAQTKVDQYKAEIVLFNNSLGENKKALTIKLKVSKGKVIIYAKVKNSLAGDLYDGSASKEEQSKRSFKKDLGEKLKLILMTL